MLRNRDGSLDDFIVAYCEEHGILCDGDIFGVMFSGAEEFSIPQAEILIDMAADLYCLHVARYEATL